MLDNNLDTLGIPTNFRITDVDTGDNYNVRMVRPAYAPDTVTVQFGKSFTLHLSWHEAATFAEILNRRADHARDNLVLSRDKGEE